MKVKLQLSITTECLNTSIVRKIGVTNITSLEYNQVNKADNI